MASFAPTTIIALVSITIFILAFLGIATLAYLKNRLPLIRYSPTPSSSRNSKSHTFYQYDPNPKYTPTASQARMSLLVVSPSCPVMVPLHSNSKGVQMMHVMITPPSPVKRLTTTGNLV